MTEESNKRVAPPIDDGDNVSIQSSKRQRVYVACEYCRLKKQKCDSKRPACSSCVSLDQQCVYGAGVKKRGLPPGYVRVLETLFGLVFTCIGHGEAAVSQLLEDAAEPLRLAALGKHEETTDEALQNFKKSGVLKLIESLLDGTHKQLDPTLDRPTVQHKSIDWQTFAKRGRGSISSGSYQDVRHNQPGVAAIPANSSTPSASTTPAMSIQVQFARLSLEAQQNVLGELLSSSPAWLRAKVIRESSITLRLPSNTWTLLELYFSFTNCWLPVMQRQEILKTFNSYQNGAVSVEPFSAEADKHAALWAVIAYASFQDPAMRPRDDSSEAQDLSPPIIYEIARSLVVPNPLRLGRGHVQAMVILSLINAGCGRSLAARKLIGDAIRAALSINQVNARMAPTNIGNTKSKDEGLMMSCFIVDTILSMLYRLPPQLSPTEVLNIEVMDTDRLEEYEPWYNRTAPRGSGPDSLEARRGPQYSFTIFTRLFSLVCILHGLSWNAQENATLPSPTQSEGILELEDWYSDLPLFCRISLPLDHQSKSQITPQILHLHIMYSSVAIQYSNKNEELTEFSYAASHAGGRHETVSNAALALLAYSGVFGNSYMPSFYRLIAHYCLEDYHVPHQLKSALAPIKTALQQIWDLEDVPSLSADLGRSGDDRQLSSRQALINGKLSSSCQSVLEHTTPRSAVTAGEPVHRHAGSHEGLQQNPPNPSTNFINTPMPQTNASTAGSAEYPNIPTEHPDVEVVTSEAVDELSYGQTWLHRTTSRPLTPPFHDAGSVWSGKYPSRTSNDFRFPAANIQSYNNTIDVNNPYPIQPPTVYANANPPFEIGSSVTGNYDLDALFNELAPLDHGGRSVLRNINHPVHSLM